MSGMHANLWMLRTVATALGPDLLRKVAFVGGSTTVLFLDDELVKEKVRHTEDVDVIVHVVGYVEWSLLQKKLRTQGFVDCMMGETPVCAMQLKDGLRVDFMPDDEKILGFSNRWYASALNEAVDYALPGEPEMLIRLVSPQHFVATKLEAWLGRGKNDPLGSQDIDDLLTLFDGRSSLMEELRSAKVEMRDFIVDELCKLMKNPGFEYAVAGIGDRDRAYLIFEKIEGFISFRQK